MDSNDSPDRSYQKTLIDQANAEMGRQRISRRELARITGIHRNTLDRLFTCERDLNVHQWDLISRALGFDPGDLARKASGEVVQRKGELPPPPGADVRATVIFLLEHPEQDAELNHRLSDSVHLGGLKGRRLTDLQGTIREGRREELMAYLGSLPPSNPHSAAQSGLPAVGD